MSAPTWSFCLVSFYAYMAIFIVVERFLTRGAFGSSERGDRDPLTYLFFVVPTMGIFVWMYVLHRWLPPHPSWLLYAAGIVIGGAGMAIRVIGKRTLGTFFTVRVQLQEDHRIIDQGIYAHLRHPLYSGFILVWAGPPLLLGSPIGLLFLTLPLALVILGRIDRKSVV